MYGLARNLTITLCDIWKKNSGDTRERCQLRTFLGWCQKEMTVTIELFMSQIFVPIHSKIRLKYLIVGSSSCLFANGHCKDTCLLQTFTQSCHCYLTLRYLTPQKIQILWLSTTRTKQHVNRIKPDVASTTRWRRAEMMWPSWRMVMILCIWWLGCEFCERPKNQSSPSLLHLPSPVLLHRCRLFARFYETAYQHQQHLY